MNETPATIARNKPKPNLILVLNQTLMQSLTLLMRIHHIQQLFISLIGANEES